MNFAFLFEYEKKLLILQLFLNIVTVKIGSSGNI
jgi:hypothetical protein